MADSFIHQSSNPNSVVVKGTVKNYHTLYGTSVSKGQFLSNYKSLGIINASSDELVTTIICKNLNMFLVCGQNDPSSSSYGSFEVKAFDLTTHSLLFTGSVEGRCVCYSEAKRYLCSAGGRNKRGSSTRYNIYPITRSGIRKPVSSGTDGHGGDGQYTCGACNDNYFVFSSESGPTVAVVDLNTLVSSSIETGHGYDFCSFIWLFDDIFVFINNYYRNDDKLATLQLVNVRTSTVINEYPTDFSIWEIVSSWVSKEGVIIFSDRSAVYVANYTSSSISLVSSSNRAGYYYGFIAHYSKLPEFTLFIYRSSSNGDIRVMSSDGAIIASYTDLHYSELGDCISQFPLLLVKKSDYQADIVLYSSMVDSIDRVYVFEGSSAMVSLSNSNSCSPVNVVTP